MTWDMWAALGVVVFGVLWTIRDLKKNPNHKGHTHE